MRKKIVEAERNHYGWINIYVGEGWNGEGDREFKRDTNFLILGSRGREMKACLIENLCRRKKKKMKQ